METLITWYNWEGRIEQQEIIEVDNLEQANLAGQYECEQQGFDHFIIHQTSK